VPLQKSSTARTKDHKEDDSMTSPSVAAEECAALGRRQQVIESFPGRDTNLGNLKILRALPIREKRLVGPWCFLDRYGPYPFTEGKPMDVAPHPHIGLQTVSWLLEGEIVHHDSLGCEGLIRPGGVNVMTAGIGIAHAEETPRNNSGLLNGTQLWVALPESQRKIAPSFQHIEKVPQVELRGGLAQVFAGTLAGVTSPAQHYSEIIGADLAAHSGAELILPLNSSHEHALLLLAGDAEIEGQALDDKTLYYLGTDRSEIRLASRAGARLLLIGGLPFTETILMWWNFVARTPEEIVEARTAWEDRQRFGEVKAYQGPRLSAPPLAKLSRPNPAS
jgi:redox-sensitive bicupin YhaK (pirin superfamily)